MEGLRVQLYPASNFTLLCGFNQLDKVDPSSNVCSAMLRIRYFWAGVISWISIKGHLLSSTPQGIYYQILEAERPAGSPP